MPEEMVTLRYEDTNAVLKYWSKKTGAGYELLGASQTFEDKIKAYFNKKKNWKVPVGNEIDDYKIVSAAPIDDFQYMEWSIIEMEGAIDVEVIYPDEMTEQEKDELMD